MNLCNSKSGSHRWSDKGSITERIYRPKFYRRSSIGRTLSTEIQLCGLWADNAARSLRALRRSDSESAVQREHMESAKARPVGFLGRSAVEGTRHAERSSASARSFRQRDLAASRISRRNINTRTRRTRHLFGR